MIRPVRYSGWSERKIHEREHQRRPDHPVENQRRAHQSAFAFEPADLLVADLGQDGIHHQQQPDRDRQRHRPDAQRVERVI